MTVLRRGHNCPAKHVSDNTDTSGGLVMLLRAKGMRANQQPEQALARDLPVRVNDARVESRHRSPEI